VYKNGYHLLSVLPKQTTQWLLLLLLLLLLLQDPPRVALCRQLSLLGRPWWLRRGTAEVLPRTVLA
jgi:hypothetical protein